MDNHVRGDVGEIRKAFTNFLSNKDLVLIIYGSNKPQPISFAKPILEEIDGYQVVVGIEYNLKGLEDIIPSTKIMFSDILKFGILSTARCLGDIDGFLFIKSDSVTCITTVSAIEQSKSSWFNKGRV